MKVSNILQKLPGRKTWHLLQFLKGYWDLINAGPEDTAQVFKLSNAMKAMMSDESPETIKAYLDSQPVYRQMLTDRYLAPKYTIADLAKYEPGTLGYAYYRHMTDNKLDLDFYPKIEIRSDFDYIDQRITESHDIWHVLTGYDIDSIGEIGLQAFYLGQTDEDTFAMTLISATCLYSVLKEPRLMGHLAQVIGEGYALGRAAKSLYPVRWEEMFGRPLAAIRAEYNINLPKISRFQAKEAQVIERELATV
jgi:ubiquinone biosynthesis protein COQ4